LSVLAHFNAIRPSSEYAALLRSGMAMWHEPWEARVADAPALLHRIWERANAGELGEALQRTCSSASGALAPLCRLAARLLELVSHMEVGLVHNDLSLEHVGRRRQTGELLLFDLDDIGLTPRFYDVAGWLGAPDQIESRCAPREELAQHYLAAYARRGGIAPPLTAFLDEIRALWLVSEFSWLQWYLHEALEEPWERTRRGDEDYRRESREGLHRHLAILLAQVGDGGISFGTPR
jgi:Ser/Thr protein kinase RdoA (MazF antagonist)